MKKFSFSIEEAKLALAKEDNKNFTRLLQHGTMQVEFFVPGNIDTQQPHKQDEIYIIASGTSGFVRNGETITCGTGDFIFVPAGMQHQFINMSADFATWVIFYGADGGEILSY